MQRPTTRSALLAALASAVLASCEPEDIPLLQKGYEVEHVQLLTAKDGAKFTLGGRMRFGPPEAGGGPSVNAPRPTADESKSGTIGHIVAILAELRLAHRAAEREAVIRKAAPRLPLFKDSLVDLIFDASTPYLPEAIELAVALRVTDAIPALAGHATGTNAQIAALAIRGVEKLYPWSDEDVRRFLRDKRVPILMAALEILPDRGNRHLDLVVPLLGHSSAPVSTAASRAMPVLGDGWDVDQLCAFARKSQGGIAIRAIQAIGRTGIPPDAEKCLIDLLDHRDASIRFAALQALAEKPTPLGNPGTVWSVARERRYDMRSRLQALMVLERSGKVPLDEVRSSMRFLPKVLQVVAARCLLRAGDRTALPYLVDLVGAWQSNDIEPEYRMFVTQAALEALREVSGRDLPRSSRVWRKWLGELDETKLRPLQTPASAPW